MSHTQLRSGTMSIPTWHTQPGFTEVFELVACVHPDPIESWTHISLVGFAPTFTIFFFYGVLFLGGVLHCRALWFLSSGSQKTATLRIRRDPAATRCSWS